MRVSQIAHPLEKTSVEPEFKTSLIIIATGIICYQIGKHSGDRKKVLKARDSVITLSTIYKEIAIWVSEEGLKLSTEEFERILSEKVAFLALVAKAT